MTRRRAGLLVLLGGSGVGEYFDGAGGDAVNAIALDCTEDAYVAGITISGDFPVTRGGFQTINRMFKHGDDGSTLGTWRVRRSSPGER